MTGRVKYSDFIVYVDESGDHQLASVDSDFPVFVLAFCVFRKAEYIEKVVPALQALKFKWFGHDAAILHERDIRKDIPPFHFLKTKESKNAFLDELTSILDAAPMEVIASVIRKSVLKQRYVEPDNPYHLSLLFCIERLQEFLQGKGQADCTTHIVFEQRGGRDGGGKEDKVLELEFRRIKDGAHYLNGNACPNLEIQFISKKSNSSGLQIADLLARPIGLSVCRPGQPNRAYEVISRKLTKSGLKIFP